MNPFLEQACHRYWLVNCEAASLGQLASLAFLVAFTAIATAWLVSKVRGLAAS